MKALTGNLVIDITIFMAGAFEVLKGCSEITTNK